MNATVYTVKERERNIESGFPFHSAGLSSDVTIRNPTGRPFNSLIDISGISTR